MSVLLEIGERHDLAIRTRRWAYAVWLILIAGFALLHALHLGADFPNNSPWMDDWAKYTDEGWYGNAAVRAHLFGNWYMPGDFNPAPAVPVWPFLEWVVFFLTGVRIEVARGLAVAFFFASLVLSYLFLRTRGPRWMALLAVTFLVTNPFLYAFSRLAILEPMLITLTLVALNLAVRLPRFRRPVTISALIGVLFTLMMLTKTTAVFLLPALGWALVAPLWPQRKLVVRCAAAAAGTFTLLFGAWIGLVIQSGLWRDYEYLFIVNRYPKPTEFYWPLLSLWWSFYGGLWIDHVLIPLAGLVPLGVLLTWRYAWSRELRCNPVFVASLLAVGGYILFMTYQNHPQPRYFTVVAFFSFFVVAMGIQALLRVASVRALSRKSAGAPGDAAGLEITSAAHAWWKTGAAIPGMTLLGAAVAAACVNSGTTAGFAMHPEYTLVPAAQQLARYIDQHPNGKRLLLSISGDEITMITDLPAICDDFGTQDLVSKLKAYQPGWFATWNDVDPGTLADLHNHYSLEQVASFRAFDHPERNLLVLFKLHPLPNGKVRDPEAQNLQIALPGDKIDIPIE
jgi:4-amino-4-deoxy-L-arabinose transferase-like glycosyltransferase